MMEKSRELPAFPASMAFVPLRISRKILEMAEFGAARGVADAGSILIAVSRGNLRIPFRATNPDFSNAGGLGQELITMAREKENQSQCTRFFGTG
jgi:hypothetical protein